MTAPNPPDPSQPQRGEPLTPWDPQRLGGYDLVAKLGQGGMGTVYLGRDEAGRDVVVKMIKPELAAQEEFRQRFRREVAAARRVHPFCTAAVLDAGLPDEASSSADPLYVVTEYVSGPTLSAAVAERGRLHGGDLEGLAVGVATALAAIHGAGVIHRDLKPENVLLSPVGPRVIDFGVARALETESGLTATGQMVGTPAYIAPEMIQGEHLTEACDVFAWGCVVAFAASGKDAFAGPSMPAIFYQIVQGEPNLEALTGRLRELVAAALAKDPARRPAAAELVDRLTGRSGADPAAVANMVQLSPAAVPPANHSPVPPAPVPPMPGPPPGPPPRSTPPSAYVAAPTAPMNTGPRHRGWWIAGIGGGLLAAAAGAVAVVLIASQLGGTDSRGTSAGPDPSASRSAASGDRSTASPAMSAPPPSEVFFADDFSDPGSGWDRDNYRDGALVVSVDKGYDYAYHNVPWPGRMPERLLIGADLRFDSRRNPSGEDEAGVYCRAGNGASYKLLLLRKGTAVIRKRYGEQAETLAVSTSRFPGDEVHRLQALCDASAADTVRLVLWVDGRLAVRATDRDSPLLDGPNAGLIAHRPARSQTDEPGPLVWFDDVEVGTADG